jgi:ABC-type sulfate transport system permease component
MPPGFAATVPNDIGFERKVTNTYVHQKISYRCFIFNFSQISMNVKMLVLAMYMRHAPTFQGLTLVRAMLDIPEMVPPALVSKL